MAMGSLDSTTVTLVPGQMIMSQKLNMPIFRNIDWNLGDATFENGKILVIFSLESEHMKEWKSTNMLILLIFLQDKAIFLRIILKVYVQLFFSNFFKLQN